MTICHVEMNDSNIKPSFMFAAYCLVLKSCNSHVLLSIVFQNQLKAIDSIKNIENIVSLHFLLYLHALSKKKKLFPGDKKI